MLFAWLICCLYVTKFESLSIEIIRNHRCTEKSWTLESISLAFCKQRIYSFCSRFSGDFLTIAAWCEDLIMVNLTNFPVSSYNFLFFSFMLVSPNLIRSLFPYVLNLSFFSALFRWRNLSWEIDDGKKCGCRVKTHFSFLFYLFGVVKIDTHQTWHWCWSIKSTMV